jgi:hypothetical protein
VVSADGRWVAYRSWATNLVAGGTDGHSNIYLYDRLSGSTVLVSANALRPGGGESDSFLPVFSGDGQTLFFQSESAELAPGDFNGSRDLFAVSISSLSSIPLFQSRLVSNPLQPGACVLSWPAVPGKNYRVQFKLNLTDDTWQDLNVTPTISGDQAYVTNVSAGRLQGFLRVIAN